MLWAVVKHMLMGGGWLKARYQPIEHLGCFPLDLSISLLYSERLRVILAASHDGSDMGGVLS